MKPKTHDYTHRHWGHDYAIMKVEDDGQRLRLMGWGIGIKKNDYLLLQQGARGTRYQVAEVKYLGNPRDMWKINATFAPRQHETT